MKRRECFSSLKERRPHGSCLLDLELAFYPPWKALFARPRKRNIKRRIAIFRKSFAFPGAQQPRPAAALALADRLGPKEGPQAALGEEGDV